MSWKATALVADVVDNITRSEKLLLLCLANRYNDDDKCAWASLPNLARQALMSERTAHRALLTLTNKGLIAVGERPGQTSVYLIRALSDRVDTSDKMAGVINWRWGGEADKNVTPPLTFGDENVTPPLTKQMITRITLDTTGADEQRTVNEPSGTVSEKKGAADRARGREPPASPPLAGSMVKAAARLHSARMGK